MVLVGVQVALDRGEHDPPMRSNDVSLGHLAKWDRRGERSLAAGLLLVLWRAVVGVLGEKCIQLFRRKYGAVC
jgi:hypothetical protein